jgi:aryl-alcohol dehydrogenase-like predicted oxidoreductase
MRKVELVPGVHSSILGFGCAPILGAVGATQARRALDCAMDCGVNHFDLARSYGYGEAEGFMGRYLRGKRQHVVLASKFGIRANWKAQMLRPLKPWVRWMRTRRKDNVNTSPGLAAQNLNQADRFHDRIPLRGHAMRQSLHASLRALRTDYLDVFFVHEPREALEYQDELKGEAEKLKSEGKIRAWGLSFDWDSESFLKGSFDRFDLLQFNNSPGALHYDQVKTSRSELPNLFFSPFRSVPAGMTASEMLKQMYGDFPNSVVLCSMFQERHIQQNSQIASDP